MVRYRHVARKIAGGVGTVLIYSVLIILLPCICVSSTLDDHQNERRRGLRAPLDSIPRSADDSIPHHSRRRLSITSETQLKRTCPQYECSLFRLPSEVRVEIWKYAVGRQTVHMYWEKRRLCSKVCRWPSVTVGGVSVEKRDDCHFTHCNFSEGLKGTIPLLQTCRRIYQEASPYIYSASVLDFKTHVNHDRWRIGQDYGEKDLLPCIAIQNLPRSFGSARYTSIQYISFHWSGQNWYVPKPIGLKNATQKPRYWDHCWFKTWKTLAEMPNLRELRVKLFSVYHRANVSFSEFTKEEDVVLMALVDVKPKKVFEVEVFWPLKEDGKTRKLIQGRVFSNASEDNDFPF